MDKLSQTALNKLLKGIVGAAISIESIRENSRSVGRPTTASDAPFAVRGTSRLFQALKTHGNQRVRPC
jgi:hypothetical protein